MVLNMMNARCCMGRIELSLKVAFFSIDLEDTHVKLTNSLAPVQSIKSSYCIHSDSVKTSLTSALLIDGHSL